MKVETVAEQLLFATLRVEAPPRVGTGFIVEHEWADKKGMFLITNKHVVEHTGEGQLTFTLADQSSDASRPSIGQSTSITLSGDFWNWTGHPSYGIDVAALALSPVISHLEKTGQIPYYRSIHREIIPGQDVLEDFDAVEEVLFVGYPSGIYDRVNNLPIIRRGTTATHPAIDYEGRPTFLIDASVFQGSSGSPVLIYNNGSWRTRDGRLVHGQRAFFLGILGQSYSRKDDGSLHFEDIPTAVKPIVKTTQMIDLGIVHKAQTVSETIEHLLRKFGELPEESITAETGAT